MEAALDAAFIVFGLVVFPLASRRAGSWSPPGSRYGNYPPPAGNSFPKGLEAPRRRLLIRASEEGAR